MLPLTKSSRIPFPILKRRERSSQNDTQNNASQIHPPHHPRSAWNRPPPTRATHQHLLPRHIRRTRPHPLKPPHRPNLLLEILPRPLHTRREQPQICRPKRLDLQILPRPRSLRMGKVPTPTETSNRHDLLLHPDAKGMSSSLRHPTRIDGNFSTNLTTCSHV